MSKFYVIVFVLFIVLLDALTYVGTTKNDILARDDPIVHLSHEISEGNRKRKNAFVFCPWNCTVREMFVAVGDSVAGGSPICSVMLTSGTSRCFDQSIKFV